MLVGRVIIIIIAVTAGVFVWQCEKSQKGVPQTASTGTANQIPSDKKADSKLVYCEGNQDYTDFFSYDIKTKVKQSIFSSQVKNLNIGCKGAWFENNIIYTPYVTSEDNGIPIYGIFQFDLATQEVKSFPPDDPGYKSAPTNRLAWIYDQTYISPSRQVDGFGVLDVTITHSPDNNKIAFIAQKEDSVAVFVSDPNFENPIQVYIQNDPMTYILSGVDQLIWLSNSKRISFYAYNQPGPGASNYQQGEVDGTSFDNLVQVDIDGKNLSKMKDLGVILDQPQSANDQYLAIGGPDGGFLLVDLKSDRILKELGGDNQGRYASVSPDGKNIAFIASYSYPDNRPGYFHDPFEDSNNNEHIKVIDTNGNLEGDIAYPIEYETSDSITPIGWMK